MENKYPFYQSVYTRYCGPTNSRGSRIICTMNKGFGEKIRYTASYDYAAHDVHDAAIAKFAEIHLPDGWKCIGKGHSDKGYVYLFQWGE